MAIFTSEYECKLDAKGRLVLPAKLKAALPESPSNELFLRRGLEPCLVLRTILEVKKEYHKLANLDDTDEEARSFQRAYFRREVVIEMDNAGRILIPKSLIKYAQLDKEATIVGVGNRIEIWNPDLLIEHDEKLEQNYAEWNKKYLSKGE
ncbi:division/cell wall cluster transcriptional repressor MraZ [Pleomorphovibrio marinus]|uniref:division/cell wall cluster transcriptional repressor MraZ n=1 Tax=Pleomorphovibrio marinus TaxID=2164132 RepID=UPI000E0BBBC4|nr:division/cell wall cluster transcriptional repressor MraZ [Pleomorphovibrio marinus]